MYFVIALILGALSLSGCSMKFESNSEPPFVIRIESSDSDEVVKMSGNLGSGALLKSFDREIVVSISRIDAESIDLTTSEPMAPEGATGGIDLTHTTVNFTLVKGEPLKICTPTTDTGTTFTLNYELLSVE